MSLREENRELKFKINKLKDLCRERMVWMILLAVFLVFFTIIATINANQLSDMKIYKVEELKTVNNTVYIESCDGEIVQEGLMLIEYCWEEETTQQVKELQKVDRQEVEEFFNSEECRGYGDCRRNVECCMAHMILESEYFNDPVEQLKFYCIQDHEDEDLYICGKYNFYIDSVKNLNKDMGVWFRF